MVLVSLHSSLWLWHWGFQGNRACRAASSRDMLAHSGSAEPVFHPQCPGFLSQSQHSASLCHGGTAPRSQTGDEQKETKNKCLMTHTIHPVFYSLCLSPFTQKQKKRDTNHCGKHLEKFVEQKGLHLFDFSINLQSAILYVDFNFPLVITFPGVWRLFKKHFLYFMTRC